MERSQPIALVVDDEAQSCAQLTHAAERAGFRVIVAPEGPRAVEIARDLRPDLILMDVELPGGDGLGVLRDVREVDPDAPIVVVTAAGHPEVGARALDLGAANFVLKPCDPREIRFVIERVSAALREEDDLRSALETVRSRTTALSIPSDVAILGPVVSLLGRELRQHYPGHEIPTTDVKLALYEALANAVEHGNLEIGFEEKTAALAETGGVKALIDRRRAEPRLRDRRAYVDVAYEPGVVQWKVRDEGPGFSPEEIERLHSLGDASSLHGRGIRLMRHFMDEVAWNERGNEVRLRMKVRPRPPRPA